MPSSCRLAALRLGSTCVRAVLAGAVSMLAAVNLGPGPADAAPVHPPCVAAGSGAHIEIGFLIQIRIGVLVGACPPPATITTAATTTTTTAPPATVTGGPSIAPPPATTGPPVTVTAVPPSTPPVAPSRPPPPEPPPEPPPPPLPRARLSPPPTTTTVPPTTSTATTTTMTVPPVPPVRPSSAVLSVTAIWSPLQPAPGQPATVVIEVRNDGGSPAEGLVLTDEVSTSSELRSASSEAGPCTVEGRRARCSLGDLAPGEVVTVEVRVLIDREPASRTQVHQISLSTGGALDGGEALAGQQSVSALTARPPTGRLRLLDLPGTTVTVVVFLSFALAARSRASG